MLRLRRHFRHSRQLLLLKSFSTAAAPPSPLDLPLSHPTYTVWGSNTSVGKTLVSAGLASSFLLSDSPSHFLYLKPIQTGFPSDSDSRFVFQKLSSIFQRRKARLSFRASDHVLKASLPVLNSVPGFGIVDGSELAMYDLGRYEELRLVGEESGLGSRLICKTMYAWREAVSPHLAAERESGPVDDAVVLQSLQSCLTTGLGASSVDANTRAMCLVETAGGVASPGPSGSLQCDLYRCL